MNQPNIKSKVLSLLELADYQTNSIVSRMIIDKKAGSVTLFAFDKGQSLSEHTAPFDALVYILDGKAEVVISSKKYVLKQEDMIIMPANKPHAVKALERFKMLLIMVRDKNE
jgi:quercetin dioxygenase-like cupin family protein